ALFEHEEMLRMIKQSFLIDVTMMMIVEAVSDGLDQAADNLLKGFEGTVDIGFRDRSVLGIDDDGAHGEVSGSGLKGTRPRSLGLGFTPFRPASDFLFRDRRLQPVLSGGGTPGLPGGGHPGLPFNAAQEIRRGRDAPENGAHMPFGSDARGHGVVVLVDHY